jgi:hypothetical protein
LTSGGHGAAAWTTARREETSAAARTSAGRPQEPHEHRGHELGVGDAVRGDEVEQGRGVEALHDHHGPAELVDAHAEAQRRGVVQRRGRQVHVAGPEAQDVAQHRGDDDRRLLERQVRRAGTDPFGRPVVPESRACRFPRAVRRAGWRAVRHGVLERLVAGDRAAEREPPLHLRRAASSSAALPACRAESTSTRAPASSTT